MADRNFRKDLATTEAGLVEYNFVIAMKSGTGGVDADLSTLPTSFATAARTGAGIVTITLNDPFVSFRGGQVTVGNSGAWLAACYAQLVQGSAGTTAQPVLTGASPTVLIHVGNATVLADPAAAYCLNVKLLLKNSGVA
jgi:hypothetical protein